MSTSRCSVKVKTIFAIVLAACLLVATGLSYSAFAAGEESVVQKIANEQSALSDDQNSDQQATLSEVQDQTSQVSAYCILVSGTAGAEDAAYSLVFATSEQDALKAKKGTVVAAYPNVETDTYALATDVPWYSYRDKFTSVDFTQCEVKPKSTANWFNGFAKLTNFQPYRLNTSQTEDLHGMFRGCTAIEKISLSGLNLDKAKDFSGLFAGCTSLKTYTFNSDKAIKPVNMDEMFRDCTSLTKLNLTSFDTTSLISAIDAFTNMPGVTDIVFGDKWTAYRTQRTSVNGLTFNTCPDEFGKTYWLEDNTEGNHVSAKPRYDGSQIALIGKSSSTAKGYYYRTDGIYAELYDNGCLCIGQKDAVPEGAKLVARWGGFISEHYNSAEEVPWHGYAKQVKKVVFTDVVKANYTSHWFDGCVNLTTVKNVDSEEHFTSSSKGLGRAWLDFSRTIGCEYMFAGCTKLTTFTDGCLTIGTSMRDLSYMFANCTSLSFQTLTCISNESDFSKVENMAGMFMNCSSLHLVSSANWGNLARENYKQRCDIERDQRSLRSQMKELNPIRDIQRLQELQTEYLLQVKEDNEARPRLQKVYDYLQKTVQIEILSKKIEKWNTSSVTNFSGIFMNCTSLEGCPLVYWNTSAAKDLSYAMYGCTGLTSILLTSEKFTLANAENVSFMFANCTNLKEIRYVDNYYAAQGDYERLFAESYTDHGDDYAIVYNDGAFGTYHSQMIKMEFKEISTPFKDASVQLLDVSNARNLMGMFKNCSSLTFLQNIGNNGLWTDKVNANNISEMFSNCSSLESLNLSKFFVGTCAAENLFKGCSALNTVTLNGFWLQQASTRGSAVEKNPGMTIPDAPKNDTYTGRWTYSAYTHYDWDEFYGVQEEGYKDGLGVSFAAYELPCDLEVATFTWEKCNYAVVDSSGKLTIQEGKSSASNVLAQYNISELSNTRLTAAGQQPWAKYNNQIKEINIKANVQPRTSMDYWFAGMSKLKSIYFSDNGCLNFGFPSGDARSMKSMFEGCSNLTTLPSSDKFVYMGGEYGSPWDMSRMFAGCTSLTGYDFGWLPTNDVRSMAGMFDGCTKLASVNFANANTGNVKDFSEMFSGCTSLTGDWKVGNLNVSNAQTMRGMFEDCSGLTSIDLSGWNWNGAKNLTRVSSMFRNCSACKTINLGSCDASHITTAFLMFENCEKLTTIYATLLLKIPDDSSRVFTGCVNLVGGNGTKYNMYNDDAEYARVDLEGTPGYFTFVGYRVKMDGNEDLASNLPAEQLVSTGHSITLTTQIPTLPDYTFKEWNTQKDGKGKSYAPGATYTTDKDTTLYAIWTPKPQRADSTVTSKTAEYDGNAISVEVAYPEGVSEEDVTVTYIPHGKSVESEQKYAVSAGTYDVRVRIVEKDGYAGYDKVFQSVLEITKKKLTITGISMTVPFVSAKEQAATDFKVSGLMSGHKLSGLTYKASGMALGEYFGVFSGTAKILDSLDNDVTANYEIKTVPGKLTIARAQKDFAVADSSLVYCGQTAKVSYRYDGDGQVTVKSSDPSTVSIVSIDETKKEITLQALKPGWADIAINAAETESSYGRSAIHTVFVEAPDIEYTYTPTRAFNYDGTAKNLTDLQVKTEDVTVSYFLKEGDQWVKKDTLPTATDAGIYTLRIFMEKAGYKSKSFDTTTVINKMRSSLNIGTYDRNIQMVPNTERKIYCLYSGGGEITVTQSSEIVTVKSIEYDGDKNAATITYKAGKECGVVQFRFTIKDSTNYYGCQVACKVTVSQGDCSYTVDDGSCTIDPSAAGQTYELGKVVLGESEKTDGKYVRYGNSPETCTSETPLKVDSAGTYTTYFTIFDSDGYPVVSDSFVTILSGADPNLQPVVPMSLSSVSSGVQGGLFGGTYELESLGDSMYLGGIITVLGEGEYTYPTAGTFTYAYDGDGEVSVRPTTPRLPRQASMRQPRPLRCIREPRRARLS